MVHPVQSVIESLYSAGRCPRLHVNASHEDVVCPDFIREQWKERLIIDLDASYPLDLTFGETGLSADLSFGGYVTRCEFPWEAVYIVADRATGRGIVLDRNMPEDVRAMFQKSRSESAKAKNPDLRPVSAGDSDAHIDGLDPELAQGAPPPPTLHEAASATPALAEVATGPAPADEADADGKSTRDATDSDHSPAPQRRPEPTDEKQVQRRRAAFRVIDGGA